MTIEAAGRMVPVLTTFSTADDDTVFTVPISDPGASVRQHVHWDDFRGQHTDRWVREADGTVWCFPRAVGAQGQDAWDLACDPADAQVRPVGDLPAGVTEEQWRVLSRLHKWAQEMGAPWYGGAGTAAHAAIRALSDRCQDHIYWTGPVWGAHQNLHLPTFGDPVPDGAVRVAARHWSPGMLWREPTSDDLVVIDRRSAYLAALSAVRVPVGGATTRAHGFDWPHAFELPERPSAAVCGIVEVEADGPVPMLPGVRQAGKFWITTTLAFMAREHLRFTGRAFISKETRLLNSFAAKLYMLRLSPLFSGLPFREIYSQGVGLLSRPGGRIYRPDWHAAILDQVALGLWIAGRPTATHSGAIAADTDALIVERDHPLVAQLLAHPDKWQVKETTDRIRRAIAKGEVAK